MPRWNKIFFVVAGFIALASIAQAVETNLPASSHPPATFFGQQDRLAKTIADLTQAIQRDPTNVVAIGRLAALDQAEGEFGKSIALWTTFIQLNPTNAAGYKYRAMDYLADAKYDEAIKDFTAELHLNPQDAYALAVRGTAYSVKGKYELAGEDFAAACQMEPENETACNNLAWLLATCPVATLRNGPEATLYAMHACNLSQWQRASRVDTLAAAYAETGDFSNAIHYEKMALQMGGLAPNDVSDDENRLSLYEKHQPYRDTPPKQ